MTLLQTTYSCPIVLDESLTLVDLDCKTDGEVIEQLAQLLYKGGFVKDSYLANVLKREENMPTGLQTQVLGVAIPHTDSEHVIRSAIAIGLLKKPVHFKNMANPSEYIEVRLVFLLAIAEKNSVIAVLSRMAEAFLDPQVLGPIFDFKTKSELVEYVKQTFNAPLLQ
jgi:galactitol PTS system EIIA component